MTASNHSQSSTLDSPLYPAPPGYKQTEIGVIPEDWCIKFLGELFHFSGGYSASRDQLSAEGHCYLHYGDIHGATKTTVDVRTDYPNIPKLDIPLKRVPSKSLLEDGDVVFVDASEDNDGTSRHVVVVNKEKKPFISGLHTIVAKSKTGDLFHGYRRCCFQTTSVRRQFLFYAVGTKVTGISKSNIPKLLIPLPPLPEQRAIAEALSDVDELIGSLEKLIDKKRAIKTAAMQQLLTGKQRLPGFQGEWETKRLGDLLTYERPDKYIVHDTDYSEHGLVPVLTANKAFVLGYTNETFGVCQETPVIVFDDFTTDSKYATFSFKVKSSAIKLLRPKHSKVDLRYVFSRIQILPFQVRDHKRHYISEYQSLKLETPEYDEQTAIASVLSDMDAEIQALEARLEKTKAIKQGMMQELLTGKTRLVPPVADKE